MLQISAAFVECDEHQPVGTKILKDYEKKCVMNIYLTHFFFYYYKKSIFFV